MNYGYRKQVRMKNSGEFFHDLAENLDSKEINMKLVYLQSSFLEVALQDATYKKELPDIIKLGLTH